MDLTLQHYLDFAGYVSKKPLNSITEPIKYLHDLEAVIKLIQSVAYQVADVYNGVLSKIISSEKLDDIYNNPDDIVESDINMINSMELPKTTLNSVINSTINTSVGYINKPKADTKLLAPNIYTTPVVVETIDDVPDTQIHYVKSIDKFAVKINGVELCGHIGEIFVKHDNKQRVNVKTCSMTIDKALSILNNKKADNTGESKTSLLSKREQHYKKCKYYHQDETSQVKNFVLDNWMYTSDVKKSKNMYMRHFGNRSSLSTDLDILQFDSNKKNVVELFKSTIIHDILVLASLNEKKLCSNDQVIHVRQSKKSVIELL